MHYIKKLSDLPYEVNVDGTGETEICTSNTNDGDPVSVYLTINEMKAILIAAEQHRTDWKNVDIRT